MSKRKSSTNLLHIRQKRSRNPSPAPADPSVETPGVPATADSGSSQTPIPMDIDTNTLAPPNADHQHSVPNPEPESLTGKSRGVRAGIKSLLAALEASADVFGPLKSAIGGLNRCIEVFEHASKAGRDHVELVREIDELSADLAEHLAQPTGMVVTHSVRRLSFDILSEIKAMEARQPQSTGRRLADAIEGSDETAECYRRIHGHLRRLTLNITMSTLNTVNQQAMESRLARMSPAMSATYNSAESDEVKRGGCATGTREPQIKKLLEWARNPADGKICWVNGMAGTGKTTIAYTVCSQLEETFELGASFFCSRTIPECRQVKSIIPAIAYQLARFSVPFRCALDKALEEDPDAHRRALKTQYQKLIVDPMQQSQVSLPTGFIVVIDALDECENIDSLREILNVLLSTPDSLPIRFFVSSRPEPEISQKMKGRVSQEGNTLLVLHDLDADVVKSDIELFVRQELQGIPLTKTQWSWLLKRCGVLFIYASTACRFILQEYRLSTLDEAVGAIIGSGSEHMNRGDEPVIDGLYTTILEAALGAKSEMRQKHRERMRDILETVLCAGEPMKLEALAGLLGLNNAGQVDALLQPLRSVLNIIPDSGLVTTLHASFPDFMFSPDQSGGFHCKQKPRHLALAKACLGTIENIKPIFNICKISSSYYADEEVEDLDKRVKNNISPGLAYACLYWALHLDLSESEGKQTDLVYRFFTQSLLAWMEVLNLTRLMRFGLSILQDAERWCSKAAAPDALTRIAHDAQQFVSVYATNAVCQSTAHIYVSMLPFWPRHRPVSTAYMPNTVGMIEPKGKGIAKRQAALLATWRVSNRGVSSISLGTNGTLIAAASDEGIDVIDTSTGEGILHVQEPRTEGVDTVAISPDGTRVAFGNDSGVYVLEVESEQITQLCPEQISQALCVAFSPDGRRVAVGTEGGAVFICGTQLADLVLGPLKEHSCYVMSVAFSPDGRHLASGSADKAIRIWDTNNGQMAVDPLHGHTDWVLSVSYSSDGTHLAASSADGTIRVWDPQTGQTVLGPLKAHSDWVYSATFSPDGAFIASGSSDTTILVYDAQTGQPVLGPLHAHTGGVNSVIFSIDGARLFSCSSDGTIRLWNVQDRDVPTVSHAAAPSRLLSVRYSHNGLQAVSGSRDGTVGVWDVQTGEMVLGPLEGHTDRVSGVDYSPDEAYIASASDDWTLRIWSAQDGKDMHGPLQGHTRHVNCVRFSPDSSLVVSGLDDRTVRVWDVKTGQPAAGPLQRHSDRVWSVAFSPNGSHLASGSDNGTIRVWNIQTGQTVIDPLRGHKSYVMSVEFSPDGSRILSGSWDNSIRTWDAQTGQPLLVFGKGRNDINSAGFSPDSRLVASGSDNRTVCVWDAQSGDLILALEGHTDSVLNVQFSPDGSHVVSSSEDGTTVPVKTSYRGSNF